MEYSRLAELFLFFPLLRKQIMNMDHEHTFCGMWMERAVCKKVLRSCSFSRAFTQALLLLGRPGFLGPIICLISMLLFSSVYTGFHSWLMKSIKPQIVCSVMGDKWVPHLHDTFNGNIPGSVFNANSHSHVFVQHTLALYILLLH